MIRVGGQCQSTKWEDVVWVWISAQWSSWAGQHGLEVSEREREKEEKTERSCWKWKLEIAGRRNRQRECLPTVPADCACRVIISPIQTKRRIIIRGLSLRHHDFIPLTGTDTPCRLSLISSTLLNQYGRDHDKTMACASCRSGERETGSGGKKGWRVDRQDERRKLSRMAFLWEGKKKRHALIKTCSHDDYSLSLLIYYTEFVCMRMCVCIALRHRVRKGSRLKTQLSCI